MNGCIILMVLPYIHGRFLIVLIFGFVTGRLVIRSGFLPGFIYYYFFLLKIVVILNFKSCKSVHPSLFGKPEKIWTPSQNVTTVKR